MSKPAGQPVAWLCAAALLAAAFTAALVNSSEAALFGKHTTGVAIHCVRYKGTGCEVAIPERPDRTFNKVSAPANAHEGTEIRLRYRDDSVVPDNFTERAAPLAFLTIGLCLVGACLAAAVARLRSHESGAAKVLAIAVPVIFFGFLLTTCAAAFTDL